MNFIRATCLLAIIVVSTAYGYSHTNNNSFDELLFVQLWPQSECWMWKNKEAGNVCNIPTDYSSWSIHGIWPNNRGTFGPENCNKTNIFKIEEIQPIINDLEMKWINIHKDGDKYGFWKHEWEKHGTCAASIPKMDTQLKYFKTGLNLYTQYNLTHIFRKEKIHPGGVYPLVDITNIIKNTFKVEPIIRCVKNQKNNQDYLYEVRLCLNKNLKLINCDNSGCTSNCKSLVNYFLEDSTHRSVIQVK